jgi:hypothetical protein
VRSVRSRSFRRLWNELRVRVQFCSFLPPMGGTERTNHPTALDSEELDLCVPKSEIENERFVLTIRVGPDPQARHGFPARDGRYRLRLALKYLGRVLGLRCVRVGPVDDKPVS